MRNKLVVNQKEDYSNQYFFPQISFWEIKMRGNHESFAKTRFKEKHAKFQTHKLFVDNHKNPVTL